MRKRTILAFSVCAALASSALAQQQDFSKVEIKTEKLAEGVYMLTGAGGNIGVSASADGVLLIDDQYAPLSAKIRAAVAAISPKPIRFVFNTHWHGDHTGGNKELGEAGAVLVAQDNVRKRLSAEQFIEAFGQKVPPSPPAALPIVTFNDSVTFHLNDDTIQALHVPPAHTDGDSIVRFQKANVIHMGDTFFNGLYPFIDLSTGGSVDGMLAAADRVIGIADSSTKLIPGHGPSGNVGDLKAFRSMLAGARDAVRALVKAGKPTKAVIEAKPTAPWDDTWGKGFLKPADFVTILDADARKTAR